MSTPTAPTAPSRIETPCRNLCHLDPVSDLCEGCGRSRAEIAGWLGMSPEQRCAIMAELPARLQRKAAIQGA